MMQNDVGTNSCTPWHSESAFDWYQRASEQTQGVTTTAASNQRELFFFASLFQGSADDHFHNGCSNVPGQGIVCSIEGGKKSGKTSVLSALIASYLIKTTPPPTTRDHYHHRLVGDASSSSSLPEAETNPNCALPPVIVLDTSYGMEFHQITNYLKANIRAGRSRMEQQNTQCTDKTSSETSAAASSGSLYDDEEESIFLTSMLSRLHITRVDDTMDLFTTLELVRHVLDQFYQTKATSGGSSPASIPVLPPPMLIIDSANAFELCDGMVSDPQMKQSAYNDSMRQLQRVLKAHPSVWVFASRNTLGWPSRRKDRTARFANNQSRRKTSIENSTTANIRDPWYRLVTHRMTLDRSYSPRKTYENGQGSLFSFSIKFHPFTRQQDAGNKQANEETKCVVLPLFISSDGIIFSSNQAFRN